MPPIETSWDLPSVVLPLPTAGERTKIGPPNRGRFSTTTGELSPRSGRISCAPGIVEATSRTTDTPGRVDVSTRVATLAATVGL
jgi:hypothetical protein